MDAAEVTRSRSLAYCFAAVALAIVVGVPFALAAFAATDWFLVEKGYFCDGCGGQRRECAGIKSHWGGDDIRGAYEIRCVGLPYGKWGCLELNESGRFVSVKCP
jgi:hypothetical protein